MPTLSQCVAVTDHGYVAATMNAPHRIECDDGSFYVVKPRKNDRQFANELIALAIGELCGIPLFDAALVEMSSAFTNLTPTLQSKYTPGIHFGSKVPSQRYFPFWNVGPAIARSEFVNFTDFYSLIVFDETIYNTDRAGNPGNLIAVETNGNSPKFSFRAIDHAVAFTGQSWTVASLKAHVPNPLCPVFAILRDLLTRRTQLEAAATNVQSQIAAFQQSIENAQSDLTKDEREAIVELLAVRASLLLQWLSEPIYAASLPNLQ